MKSVETFIHQWQFNGRTITFSWVGNIEIAPTRVYALAFTPEGKLLLVSDGVGQPDYWLPGGGVEEGETPETALARELLEEAAATVHGVEKIGAQRVRDDRGKDEYHTFYWCRITVEETFIPKHEVSERKIVTPEAFLDTLFWGRSDPKAGMLLEQALELERWHRAIVHP